MPLIADAIAAFRRPTVRRRYDNWLYPSLTNYGSVELSDGTSASYRDIYRGQPWVYAAVNILARSVARTPLKVYRGPSSDREYVTDGELYDLFQNPWRPYGTPFRLKERLVKGVAVYGVSLAIKTNAQDQPIVSADEIPFSLSPAPSVGWKVDASTSEYVWTDRVGDEYRFQPWQVLRIDFWDCDDYGFGMSALEPLRMTLAVEDAAQRYARSAFRQGARPSSILKSDQTLKPEVADRLKSELLAIHGGVDNMFKVAVLQAGLDWAPYPAPNLDDAALVNHRALTREEVAAVFGVPQPSMGILDNANFASIDMLHTQLYQDSLGPWVTLIEESLQTQLVAPVPAFRDLHVEFDMHGLKRGSDETQYRGYATAMTTGFMTANEVRARENLPPSDQPQANMLLFPLNLSGAVGADLAEATGAPDESDVMTFSMNGAGHADAHA